MSPLRGTPAVMITMSQSLTSAGEAAAVIMVGLGAYWVACAMSMAFPCATPSAMSKSIISLQIPFIANVYAAVAPTAPAPIIPTRLFVILFPIC